ncbi:hypothetical protein [Tardiphaga sp. 42S5]|uniref:hypothetical protein n=1 Tax=Tardiphaga sp. 42S5 TaxID=1404799 RepID=UPI002A5ACC27|nr:hypothetical protein [Tardiphaga sp. 42S5]WPO40269.1 hypothetical protein SFY93_22395 [Tardiphaga sp. 42S5]
MHSASHIPDETKRAFATLWSWLRCGASKKELVQVDLPLCADSEPSLQQESGTVLQFPLRGEALLVRLAELLRRRVAELVPQFDCLSLTLSHRPLLRLSIDDNAYIEFDTHSTEFDLVIEAPSGTRMIIQTTDFDAVVKFVLQYVVEKLSDEIMLEAAAS